MVAAAGRRRPAGRRAARRTPRCACWPASPNGARWRRSSAATLVDVSVATTALQDPHQIQARPSLIARARNADLRGVHRRRAGDRLAAAAAAAIGQSQGAARAARQLRRGRRGAQARGAGAASIARRATCMRPATRTSRPIRATSRWWPRALGARLQQIDPAQRGATTRRRQADFAQRWQQAMTRWSAQAAPLKGVAVVVAAQGLCLPLRLARPEGSGRARAQAGRRADACRSCRRCWRR